VSDTVVLIATILSRAQRAEAYTPAQQRGYGNAHTIKEGLAPTGSKPKHSLIGMQCEEFQGEEQISQALKPLITGT
jgi:hypothetical protein